MDLLIRHQIRLIRTSLLLWLPLGLLSTLLFVTRESGSTSFVIGDTSGITPFLGILAAALGARLFASELGLPSTSYWRALPVSLSRQFWTKFAVGTIAILAAVLIHWLPFVTGLLPWIQAMRFDDLVPGTPPAEAWFVTGGWALLVFAASAWFAVAFDRPASATQAGVPGFFCGLMFVATDLSTFGGSLPAGVVPALAFAVATFAAARLWPRRAAVAHKPAELIRTPPRGSHAVVAVVAQLTLVAAPLTSAFNMADMAPYFGLSTLAGNALVWLAIGVLLLPWTLDQIRYHGLRAGQAVALVACNLTGLGALVWRAVRPRPAADRRARLHVAPAWILVAGILSFMFIPYALGGFRIARAWRITAPDGVEIVVDGKIVGTGTAYGLTWGPSLGDANGWWNTATSIDVRPAENAFGDGGFGPQDIDEMLDPTNAEDPPASFRAADVFAPGTRVQLLRNGQPVRADRLSASLSLRSFRAELDLRVLLTDDG